MKLSTQIAKLTAAKTKLLKLAGVLTFAGAMLTVTAPAAKAQVAFGIGVNVGPRYVAPVPRPYVAGPGYVGYGYRPYGYGEGYGRGYWDHRRYEELRAREWRERQAWDSRHSYGYNRPYGYYGR